MSDLADSVDRLETYFLTPAAPNPYQDLWGGEDPLCTADIRAVLAAARRQNDVEHGGRAT